MNNPINGEKYSHLIVSELKYEPTMSVDFRTIYSKFAKRVLWIDDHVVPGAFQMNVSWYKAVPERDPVFPEHAHPAAELLGFFGTNPEAPYALCGKIQVVLGGEPHIISGSSLIFVPPDLPHALHILEVEQPIFHFSVVMDSRYDESVYQRET